MATDPTPLWDAHQAAPTEETLEALYCHYEPLARYLAQKQLAKAPPHQDREDMISYAHHGLLNALGRFEPGRGVKFETYATRRITGAIIDGLRNQDPLSRPARKKVKDLVTVTRKLAEELDREPSLEEVAAATGIALTEIRRTLVTQKSLNASLEVIMDRSTPGGHSDITDPSLIVDHDDSGIQLDSIREALAMLLARLPDRDRAFVVFHYCEGNSLRETASRLGLTEVRGGQLRKEIIRGLKVA